MVFEHPKAAIYSQKQAAILEPFKVSRYEKYESYSFVVSALHRAKPSGFLDSMQQHYVQHLIKLIILSMLLYSKLNAVSYHPSELRGGHFSLNF